MLTKVILPIGMLILLAGSFIVPQFIVPDAKKQGEALGTFTESKGAKVDISTDASYKSSGSGLTGATPIVFPGDAAANSGAGNAHIDPFFKLLNQNEFDKAEIYLKEKGNAMGADTKATLQQTLQTRRIEKTEIDATLSETRALLAELKGQKVAPMKKKGPIPPAVTIGFGLDSSVVTGTNRKVLVSVASKMKSRSDLGLKLRGFSDSSGDPKYNAILAEARCEAAKETLVKLGVQGNRISTHAFGESQSAKGNAARKVEIVFE